MKILGNINTANKFYIKTADNNIRWVPSLETAKRYVNDPNNKNWYSKTIYATNEDIVKGYDGKAYLKSEAPEIPNFIKNNLDTNIFKEQALAFLKSKLNEIAKNNDFDSIEELISWKDSTILRLNKLANNVLKYRDECYIYYSNSLNEFNSELEDSSILYSKYMNNFPKYKE